MEVRFLSKKQVKHLTTLSFTELRRREDRDEFPKRHRLGVGRYARVVYIEAEVIGWMEAEVANARPPRTTP
jgi:predicted DNA-binding transcriptional regulator AlpA